MSRRRLLSTATRLVTEVGRLGVDAVRRRSGLPRLAADLDAATLARVLGRPVRAVHVLDGTTGTTDRARLALEGAGFPESVFVKMAARGARFVDTLTPLTPDQVAGTLATLARLHGLTHARLTRRVAQKDPTLVAPHGARILSTYGRWAASLDEGPQCVLHGDPHPGNIYLLPDVVGLLDWQAVRRGHPLRDVSHHLVLGMDVEDRRACERKLLAHYVDELAAAGGPRISPAHAWERHRRMVAYPYVAATFTYGLGGLQGEDIADEGLRRAVAAVEDLETHQALG